MDHVTRTRCLEILKTTGERLRSALEALPDDVLRWRPAPGKWSAIEIACHMRDMERDAYLARYERILAEKDPRLPDIDGDQYALEGAYRTQSLAAVLADWDRLRAKCLQRLSVLGVEEWRRRGIHETAGPLTVEDLLLRQAHGNDEAHLGQISAIPRRFEIIESLSQAPRALSRAAARVGRMRDSSEKRHDEKALLTAARRAHTAELEASERMAKAAFGTGPLRPRVKAKASGKRRDSLAETVADFALLRAETVALLHSLPGAVWRRPAKEADGTAVTIEAMAEQLSQGDGDAMFARTARR